MSAKWSDQTVEIAYEQFLSLISKSVCHYCHAPVTRTKFNPAGTKRNGGTRKAHNAYYLDRKDNAKGYTIDNLVTCCTRCNYAKGDRFTYEEWFEMTECFRRRVKSQAKSKNKKDEYNLDLFDPENNLLT
jgi:hypothetical protein